MKKVRNKLIWAGLLVLTVAFLYAIYPFYVYVAASIYTKQFAVVLDSPHIKQYDRFFSKDTVFELDGEEIEYSQARENMKKLQGKFSSSSSYGYLSEFNDVYHEKEYEVYLMLPISEYDTGEEIVTVGILEASIILERRWLFFFRIKRVIFDYDQDGFLEEFLGIGKGYAP